MNDGKLVIRNVGMRPMNHLTKMVPMMDRIPDTVVLSIDTTNHRKDAKCGDHWLRNESVT